MTNNKPSFVYEITNKSTGAKYVGKCRDPKARWGTHIHAATSPLVRAMVTEGVENFDFEVVEECTSDDEIEKESARIRSRKDEGVVLYNRSQTSRWKLKKTHLWNGRVYRNVRFQVWVAKWRETDTSPWRTKQVPPSIQDEEHAMRWFVEWLRAFIETKTKP